MADGGESYVKLAINSGLEFHCAFNHSGLICLFNFALDC